MYGSWLSDAYGCVNRVNQITDLIFYTLDTSEGRAYACGGVLFEEEEALAARSLRWRAKKSIRRTDSQISQVALSACPQMSEGGRKFSRAAMRADLVLNQPPDINPSATLDRRNSASYHCRPFVRPHWAILFLASR
jgi:hypothetical protein